MTPRVSLLVPNRNNEPALDLVLRRLAEHTTYPDFELVVVDDGSDDRSREILREWRDSGRFARFELHEQPPSGVVVALNEGLSRCTGDLVVQLDADATVETPGWLERMVDFFGSRDDVGVVSPRVVFDSGYVHAYGVNIVGAKGLHDGSTEITEPVGERTLHQNVVRFREEDVAYNGPAETDSGIGCCMMYRRDDALAVGGYDMGFQPVWFDDLDLALSIRHQRAKRNFFLPSVHVIHRVGLRDAARDVKPTVRERMQAGVGRVLPAAVKERITASTGIGGMPEAHLERLRHHYAYWREKWGWDLLNPDMDEVRRRYDGSTLLWREA